MSIVFLLIIVITIRVCCMHDPCECVVFFSVCAQSFVCFCLFCLFVLFVLFAFGLPLSLLFSSCPAVLATRNAIDALGGMATIESASKNMKETVHLQLRSQDPTSHAIIGKRQDEKAVLLKVLLFALREKTHFCGLLHRPPKPPGGAFWRQSLFVHAGSPLFFSFVFCPQPGPQTQEDNRKP